MTASILLAAAPTAYACTLNPQSPSVTICQPANGSTIPSPVQVVAGTTDNAHPVTAMKIYIDNVVAYSTSSNSINTSLTLTGGQHNLTINAWDSSGAVFKTTEFITVQGQGTGQVSVAVSPHSASLTPGQTQQFSATVINTTNTAVTWSVDGVTGGNASSGTISSAGFYTAPATAGTHNVVATSVADTTKSDTAIVSVTTGSNGPCTPQPSTGVKICAPVANSTGTSPVNVQAVVTASTTPQKVLVYIDNTLQYQALNTKSINTSLNVAVGTHFLVVQAFTNTWLKTSENFTVGNGQPSVTVTVSPTTATIPVSGTQQFTATVTNTSNTGVTWSVDGIMGGNSSVGTVSTSGLYQAPSTSGNHTVTATSVADTTKSASAAVTVGSGGPQGSVAVTMHHNDLGQTGANTQETVLMPSNVNQSTFGKKYTYGVDGQIYGQPLYLPNLSINGGTHNTVFVATQHNSVYAFDAKGGGQLWHVNFGAPVNNNDPQGIQPVLGITSTPVIDPNTGSLYVTNVNSSRVLFIHKLDVHTGADQVPAVAVHASVPGTGSGSSGGRISLSPSCYQRSALTLANGRVYLGFGHCNHGWIVAYDAGSLAQREVFSTSANGSGATVWMGGGGIAVDGSGNLYLEASDDIGTTNANPTGGIYSDAFLKLSPSLQVLDYFIPSNEAFLLQNDADIGSGAPIVMPNNELIGGGKDGRVFVLNRSSLGGYHPGGQDTVIQTIQTGTQQFDNIWGAPAYWNNVLYYHTEADVVKAYAWNGNTLSAGPVAKGSKTYQVHGASPSISANGNSNGIVWDVEDTAYNPSGGGPAILHAYDAGNVNTELYNSSQAGGRDTAGAAAKFSVPTVADGHVFVPTSTQLNIYGLLNQP